MSPDTANSCKAAAYVGLMVAIAVIVSAELPEPLSVVKLLWP